MAQRRAAGAESTPEQVFSNSPEGLRICGAVGRALSGAVPATVHTTISQVAFRNRRGFAVLSIALPRRLESSRFKEVVHPSPGVWMHHLELHAVEDVDEEVACWLEEAFAAAG
jgi:hypothetical protein